LALLATRVTTDATALGGGRSTGGIMARVAGDSGSPDTKVAMGRILAFSLPSLPLAALGLPLVVQLPAHYAGNLGLEVGIVGILFMVARLADIGIDVGIGLAMDQTRTRFGRFSPWLLACAPVVMIGAWFLFMAQPGITPIYLAAALFVTYVGFSMGSLSQMSLGATLSDNYYERSRVFVFWQAFNVIGMLLALAIPVIITRGGGTPTQGINGMGWFIIILIPLGALVAAFFAKEQQPKAEAKKTSLTDLIGLLKSQACRKLLIADLILTFASGVTGGLFLFYFAAVKGYDITSAQGLLLVYFIAGLLGAPIWTMLARRAGKHMSLIYACIFAATTQPMIMFLPEDNFPVAAAGMAFFGLVYTSAAYLLRAMMADIGDEDLLRTGQDRTGLLYALVTLTGKGGYALAVGVTFLCLSFFGFDATKGGGNTSAAIQGLTWLFIGLPVVASLVGAAFLRGYPMDAARTAALQIEIEKRRAEGSI
jgi:glycoside/pentoside/hexuronide:cation symporter, GPH family